MTSFHRLDGGVASYGAQGGHVQSAAQRSAVVGDRGDADEAGNFLIVDDTQFGQFGDEDGGDRLADAWRALQIALRRAEASSACTAGAIAVSMLAS